MDLAAQRVVQGLDVMPKCGTTFAALERTKRYFSRGASQIMGGPFSPLSTRIDHKFTLEQSKTSDGILSPISYHLSSLISYLALSVSGVIVFENISGCETGLVGWSQGVLYLLVILFRFL